MHGDEGKPSHPQAADPLLIEDPVDVFNNVARNCFRSTVVHRAFFDAYEKLKAAAVRHHQHSHHRQSSRSHARSPNIDSPVQAQRKISRSKNEELSNTLPTVRQSLRNFTVRSKSPVPVDAFYRQDRLPHPSPLTRDMTVDATEALPKLNLSSKNQPSRSTFKKLDEGDSDDGSEVLVSSAPHTISQQPIISEESRRRISEARALFESRTPRDSPLATPRESGLEKAGQDDPHRFESPKEVKNNPSDLLFNNKTLLFEILGIDVAKSQINT